MRLFVAVDMNPSVEDAAREVIDELRGRVARLAPRAKITWTAPERIHVTVRFIGDADETKTQAIRSALGPTIDAPVFDVTIDGVGAFPPKGPLRVVWAGLTDGRNGLLEVERAVSQRLETLVPAEDRPYSPHLTLARVKEPAGLARAPLFEGLADRHFGTVHVDAITLFESRLSPKGATHVPLQRTALRRRTQD
jgi:RNA 2',3'-cyclic 3'-phosphodiesterase